MTNKRKMRQRRDLSGSCNDCRFCNDDMWSSHTKNPGECAHPSMKRHESTVMIDLDEPGRPIWCPLSVFSIIKKTHGKGKSTYDFLKQYIVDHVAIKEISLVLESGDISRNVKLCFYRDAVRRFDFVKAHARREDQFWSECRVTSDSFLRSWGVPHDAAFLIEEEVETGARVIGDILKLHDVMRSCAEIMYCFHGAKGKIQESRWFARTLIHWMDVEKMTGERIWAALKDDNMMARPARCSFDYLEKKTKNSARPKREIHSSNP